MSLSKWRTCETSIWLRKVPAVCGSEDQCTCPFVWLLLFGCPKGLLLWLICLHHLCRDLAIASGKFLPMQKHLPFLMETQQPPRTLKFPVLPLFYLSRLKQKWIIWKARESEITVSIDSLQAIEFIKLPTNTSIRKTFSLICDLALSTLSSSVSSQGHAS